MSFRVRFGLLLSVAVLVGCPDPSDDELAPAKAAPQPASGSAAEAEGEEAPRQLTDDEVRQTLLEAGLIGEGEGTPLSEEERRMLETPFRPGTYTFGEVGPTDELARVFGIQSYDTVLSADGRSLGDHALEILGSLGDAKELEVMRGEQRIVLKRKD